MVALVRSARLLGAVVDRRFQAPVPTAVRSGTRVDDAGGTMVTLVVIAAGAVDSAGGEPTLVGETRAVTAPFSVAAGRAWARAERVAFVTTPLAV
jgi:hypothetical protein